MILKEAFRNANYLADLAENAEFFLQNSANVTRVTEEHLRKKADKDAENETMELPRDTDFNPSDVICFLIHVGKERQTLMEAISKAKAGADIDMDTTIAANKSKQGTLRVLKYLSGIKADEKMVKGKAYRLNNEGNQTTYTYDIRRITKIDFDRNEVKKLAKRLQTEIDKASAKIDLLDVTLEVEYEPVYTVGDSFEDSMETFLSLK